MLQTQHLRRGLGLILFALLGLLLATRAAAEPPPRSLPPPWASGAGVGLLGPAPAPAGTGGHLRGTFAISGAGAGAPLLFEYRLGASASAFGWAEAGATFGGRWLSVGQHQAGPVELWLRAGPRWGGTVLQAVAEVASGRGGFDLGGTVYPSTTTLGAVVGAVRGRFAGWLSAAYQSGGEDLAAARYRGVQLGAAAWLAVFRDPERYDVQLGAEALARVGWTAERGGEVAAVFALTARLADEHGAAFAAGGGKGWGGDLAQSYGAVRIGYSFGPSYRHERDPSVKPLLDELQQWLGELWAHRTRPGFAEPLLPPPALPALVPPLAAGPSAPGWTLRAHRPLAPPGAASCGAPVLRDTASLALVSCSAVASAAIEDAAQRWAPPLPPDGTAPLYGPPGPALPPGPPALGHIAQVPPRAPPRGAAPTRGPLRTGRGTGWTDPDTRAPAPLDLPPQVWIGGPPGTGSVLPPGAPVPPPSIPIRPQPPGPLPPTMRPQDVPPALRPPPPPRADAAADQRQQPMGPPAPAPPRSGGAAPVRRGQAAVEAERAARLQAGEEVLGAEVTFRTRLGGRRADLVVRKPDGEVRAVEVKAGGSPIIPAQAAKDRVIESEGAVAVGKRARRAGIAGPIKVKTEVVRRP